jgi:hypothetical protein
MPPAKLLENRDRADARGDLQHRHDLGGITFTAQRVS